MRIIIHPSFDPTRDLDVTNRLVSVIAEELWKNYGGNELLNWLEAERQLERLVGASRAECDGLNDDLPAAADAKGRAGTYSKRTSSGRQRSVKGGRGGTRGGHGKTGVARGLALE